MIGDAARTSASQARGSMSLSFAVMMNEVHRRCSLSSTIGAGKQPRLPSERDPAQRPFGSIVRQADPSITRKRLKASQRLSM